MEVIIGFLKDANGDAWQIVYNDPAIIEVVCDRFKARLTYSEYLPACEEWTSREWASEIMDIVVKQCSKLPEEAEESQEEEEAETDGIVEAGKDTADVEMEAADGKQAAHVEVETADAEQEEETADAAKETVDAQGKEEAEEEKTADGLAEQEEEEESEGEEQEEEEEGAPEKFWQEITSRMAAHEGGFRDGLLDIRQRRLYPHKLLVEDDIYTALREFAKAADDARSHELAMDRYKIAWEQSEADMAKNQAFFMRLATENEAVKHSLEKWSKK